MTKHLGDYDINTVIYGKFTTFRPSTGAAFTLAGSPVISVYKDNDATQSTSGITLTPDFDGIAGFNHFTIDTASDGIFYSSGSNYDVVVTAGTVDGVSIAGAVIASFTILKGSNLTADQVSNAVWDADINDHGNVDSFGYVINEIITAVDVNIPTQISGLNNITANDVWAAGTRTLTSGANIVLAKGTGLTGLNDITAANVWANTTRTLSAGTNIVLAKGTGITGFNDITAANVWGNSTRTLTAGTNIVLAKGTGVTGFNDLSAAQVNAEVDAGLLDVGLTTTVTGRIDADISSRMATFAYTAPDNAGITSIKGVTDKIDTALQLDGAVYQFTTNALENAPSGDSAQDVWEYSTRILTSGDNIVLSKGVGVTGFNDISAAEVGIEVTNALDSNTAVGDIKAKTDQLTFTVPGQVDSNAESMNGAEILGNGTDNNLWRGGV